MKESMVFLFLLMSLSGYCNKFVWSSKTSEANFSCQSLEIKKEIYLTCIRNQENSILITKKLIIN